MTEPFAYRAEHDHFRRGAECVRVMPTLAALVREIATTTDYRPGDLAIVACYPDGNEETVPPERYSEPDPPSRAEAEAWVRDRIRRVEQWERERPGKPSIARFGGAFRASYDDPIEKQIEDYIKSAPRRWRLPEDAAAPPPTGRAGDGG